MGELIELPNINVSDDDQKQMASIHQLKQSANQLTINNQQDYEQAADFIGDVSSRINKLEAMRKRLKAPTLEAGRLIDSLFKIPINTGKDAKKIIQDKMLSYVHHIEEEKKSLEKAALEEAIKQQEIAEEAAMLALAEGDDEKAQDILENVDVMPMPAKIIESPKANGISTRSNWKAKVTDIDKLLRAVVNRRAPISLIQVDMVAANKMAKAVRNTLEIDGLEFYNDVSLTARRK